MTNPGSQGELLVPQVAPGRLDQVAANNIITIYYDHYMIVIYAALILITISYNQPTN